MSDASAGWYKEKKDYKYSKTKRIRVGPTTGRYTQMIWKDTKEVGISYAISKSGSVYVVARYYPWETIRENTHTEKNSSSTKPTPF